jgi:hypothetical protein
MSRNYRRICLGSSGEYSDPHIHNDTWRGRMDEAMQVLCNERGEPRCKLHGLRMMAPAIFTTYPLSSADSTNVAQNQGRKPGSRTKSKYQERENIAWNIECHNSGVWVPGQYAAETGQQLMFRDCD